MQLVVLLDPVKELLSAFRVLDMLDTDVYPLLDVAVADDFVDKDTDSVRSNIVDNTSTP